MIKNLVESIGGIGLYGLISMLLFVAVFTGMLVWTMRLKKPYLNQMGNLPLDLKDEEPEEGEDHE